MNVRLSPFLALVAAACIVASGCRTNKDILNDYEKALVAGDYESPVAEIEGKAEDGGVDELLWRLHAGGSRYLMNDLAASVDQFDKAEDVFIRNDQTSVFKQGATGTFAMISNDRAFPYSGGGEDRIFTCLYKAVDYARSGQIGAARTELNRAAQHQDNWLWERKKEIAEAAERMRSDAAGYTKKEAAGATLQGDSVSKANQSVDKAFSNASFSSQVKNQCGFDMATGGNLEMIARKDWLNRYAEHVTGVFRWLAGDGDGAGYLKELVAIDPANAIVASDLSMMSRGGRPSNMVWIYVEDGLGPMREEWRLDLPTVLIPYLGRYVIYAGMALPYLRYRNDACASYTVAAGGKSSPFVLLQDVDALMKTEFDVYFRGALAREITRTIVKIGVQVALGVTADNVSDDYTRIALKSSQIAAAAWAAAVTQADLRSWTGLPKKVYLARVPRPADGRIVLSGGGMPVAEIQVPAGNSLVFVRKTSAQAPAVVKTVVFAQ